MLFSHSVVLQPIYHKPIQSLYRHFPPDHSINHSTPTHSFSNHSFSYSTTHMPISHKPENCSEQNQESWHQTSPSPRDHQTMAAFLPIYNRVFKCVICTLTTFVRSHCSLHMLAPQRFASLRSLAPFTSFLTHLAHSIVGQQENRKDRDVRSKGK